jgi:transposase-like protein
MSNNKPLVSADVKQQIMERVKKGDVPITQIASEHGISPKNIYNWLSRGAISFPTWTELNKLKKENRELKELIGSMSYELSISQKNT